MKIVVVSGLPGSGKTTLARRLAPALRLPLIEKDVIKESLFEALGSGDLASSQQLGRAAFGTMYGLARRLGSSMVLEAHFVPGLSEPDLLSLEQPLVQVWCRCPTEVAWARYQRRRDDPERHPGHHPVHQDEAATEHWRSIEPRPLNLGAPLLEVDTSGERPVDVDQLVTRMRQLLR